jgi:hypothetical protein
MVGRSGLLATTLCLTLVALASLAPTTQAARQCAVPDYPGSGYFTSLSVKRTSCATGGRLARAYYRCRTENGKAGRCRRGVMGFSCSETRSSIPTELNARVRCKRGAKRVIHTYQQNL